MRDVPRALFHAVIYRGHKKALTVADVPAEP